MISADRWRVCLEHLRWTDSDATGGKRGLSLKLLPETVEAHREREALDQRYGLAGRQVFADAFQIAVHWWTHLPDTARWVRRAWDADLETQTVPTAPLVLMPEVAAVAARLVAFERAGRRDGPARTRWMEGLRGEMDRWGVDFSVGRLALMDWLQRHSAPAAPTPDAAGEPAAGTTSQARQARAGMSDAGVAQELRLSAGHERTAQPTGVLAAASCLPWQLGESACEM